MKSKIHHRKKRKIASLDVVERFSRLKTPKFLRQYDAQGMAAALKEVSGELQDVACLQFFVNKKKGKSEIKYIPKQFNYKNYKILTDVVVEDEVSNDSAPFQPGDGAYREGGYDKGTIGLKVFRKVNSSQLDANGQRIKVKKYFALSCFHVFCRPELDNKIFPYVPTAKSKVFTDSGGEKNELGKVTVGIFNSSIDAALVELNDEKQLSKLAKALPGTPCGIRFITTSDIGEKTKLILHGDRSHYREGLVLGKNIPKIIKYSSGRYAFKNLIRATKMSDPGDSGACVFDDEGKVVGILSASSNDTKEVKGCSYIIPIMSILAKFNIKIDQYA